MAREVGRIVSIIVLILAIPSVLVAFALHIAPDDVLARLQTRAMAISVSASGITIPEDNLFYAAAQRVMKISEHDLGAKVLFEPLEVEGAAGMTMWPQRVIVIEETLHWTARYETLTHEAAHLLQPPSLQGVDKEAFAEGVACVVDTWDGDAGALERSAGYLAGGKGSLHILTDFHAEIMRAALILEGR